LNFNAHRFGFLAEHRVRVADLRSLPDTADPVSAFEAVSHILRRLPQFEELGGNIVLDQSPT
jgi:hypothetical protein